MGLAIEIGILAELKRNDEEGLVSLRDDFVRLNQALHAARLCEHHEPEDIQDDSIFSCDMYGYSGLHYLRRIAAYEAFGYPMPQPGDDNASGDRVVKRYYSEFTGGSFFARLLRRQQNTRMDFTHLMKHSDAEGYYVPQDFEQVLFPNTSLKIPGGMIGSTQRLLAECKRLAKLLELPSDLDHESDELWDAIDEQGESDIKWKRYAVESFTCIRLIRACEASLRLGAVIYFC
ncbi:MAG: hypothetical protein ABFD54_08820 [Armatimonadota bacterium]|nr:hypothetical protein [bacterium]